MSVIVFYNLPIFDVVWLFSGKNRGFVDSHSFFYFKRAVKLHYFYRKRRHFASKQGNFTAKFAISENKKRPKIGISTNFRAKLLAVPPKFERRTAFLVVFVT